MPRLAEAGLGLGANAVGPGWGRAPVGASAALADCSANGLGGEAGVCAGGGLGDGAAVAASIEAVRAASLGECEATPSK